MPKADSSVSMLVVTAALVLGIGYFVPETLSHRSNSAKAETPKAETAKVAQSQTKPAPKQWAASAPGRVEPLGGEIRISAQAPGRITDVLVRVNDKVAAGDLLVSF